MVLRRLKLSWEIPDVYRGDPGFLLRKPGRRVEAVRGVYMCAMSARPCVCVRAARSSRRPAVTCPCSACGALTPRSQRAAFMAGRRREAFSKPVSGLVSCCYLAQTGEHAGGRRFHKPFLPVCGSCARGGRRAHVPAGSRPPDRPPVPSPLLPTLSSASALGTPGEGGRGSGHSALASAEPCCKPGPGDGGGLPSHEVTPLESTQHLP